MRDKAQQRCKLVITLLQLDFTCEGKAVVLDHVAKLYNSFLHSDVSIIVENVKIPAHRQILAAHSQVFRQMWEHHLLEVRHRRVTTPLLELLSLPSIFSRQM